MAGLHSRYAGRRVLRYLFQSRTGIIINNDVNAAYNILQQAVPEAFADGIEGGGYTRCSWDSREHEEKDPLYVRLT